MSQNRCKIGDFIEQTNIKNETLKVKKLLGVSIEKKFIDSIANTVGTDFSNYKIVNSGEFAYGPVTSRNGDKLSIALLKDYEQCIVSSSYITFKVKENVNIIPDYLMLIFSNAEFDRYARYNSWGSVREMFQWEDLCAAEINLPSMNEQEIIVKRYNYIKERIAIIEQLKNNLIETVLTYYNNLLGEYTIDSDELPNGWRKTTIGEYADVKSGYAFKSEWWTNTGIPTIKIGNIVENSINIEFCDYVIDENAKKAKDFWVKKGDLLIAMTGATTGKIGIVSEYTSNSVVNQRVGKFFLGNEPLKRLPFLFCVLNSKEVAYQIHPNGDKGSAQDNLSPDDIKNIKIIMPPNTIINDFNLKLNEIFNFITILDDEKVILNKVINNLINSSY